MNTLKKVIAFTVLGVACCVGFAACADDPKEEPQPAPSTDLVLKAAPTSVKAGEEVTFIVTNEGIDVTASAQVLSLTEDGKIVTGKWTSSKPGAYQFAALYEGRTSVAINVTVQSGIVTGNYKRRILAVDFTGTQCGPCVNMTNMLKKYEKDNPDRLVVMAAHVNVPAPDPLTIQDGTALFVLNGLNSTPNLWVDYREKCISYTPATLKSYVSRSLELYPAICGIKISSSVSGTKISADVAVRFTEGGNFKICAVALEDNIVVPGGYEPVYNHVLRQFATSASGDSIGDCVGGQEYTKTFEFTADPSWNLANCQVLIYLLNSNNGQYFVNNVRLCPANGAVDFDEEL